MSKYNVMMPKTFTFENSRNLYVPLPVRKFKNMHYGCCVHLCNQFLKYPVDNWGRRIVPSDAKCPYVIDENTGQSCVCGCGFVCVNGKIVSKFINTVQLYNIYENAREH